MEALEARYMVARDALSANLALQSRLEDTLVELEQGIITNAEQQAKIQSAALQMNRSGWYTGLKAVDFGDFGKVGPRTVGPSHFWMTGGQVPKPNEDTLKLREAFIYLPHSFSIKKWTEEEDAELQKLLLQAVQEAVNHNIVQSDLQADESLTGTSEAQAEECNSVKMEDPEISLVSGSEEVVVSLAKGRWEVIAMQLRTMHSGTECRNRWANHLRPSLKQSEAGNAESWTQDEDQRLCEIAQTRGKREWELIAAELNCGRSPVQCLSRFQQLQPPMSDPWTPEELKQVLLTEAKHANTSSKWKNVAAEIPGRKPMQCLHQWRKQQLQWQNMEGSSEGRCRWTKKQDQQLRAAVAAYGEGKWMSIATAVPGKTDRQARERWVRTLNSGKVKSIPWTAEEDAILRKGADEYKKPNGTIGWSQIAKFLPGRTDAMCKNHHVTLMKFDQKKGVFKEKKAKAAIETAAGEKRKRVSDDRGEASDTDEAFDEVTRNATRAHQTLPAKSKGNGGAAPRPARRRPQQKRKAQVDPSMKPGIEASQSEDAELQISLAEQKRGQKPTKAPKKKPKSVNKSKARKTGLTKANECVLTKPSNAEANAKATPMQLHASPNQTKMTEEPSDGLARDEQMPVNGGLLQELQCENDHSGSAHVAAIVVPADESSALPFGEGGS